MATKTIAERLADAHQRSVRCYLQRQEIEAQRQAVAQAAQRCDQELVRLDGEIAVLTDLVRADGTPEGVGERGE